MKKSAIILISALFYQLTFSQTFTVNGIVKDAKTNNPVIGAAVFELSDATIGTATDTEGFFSLSFEKTHILLKVAYIGYKDTVFDLHLQNDTALIVNLISETDIDEVEIEDDSLNWKPQSDTISGNYKKIIVEKYNKEPEIKPEKFVIPLKKEVPKENINNIYFSANNEVFGKVIYLDDARVFYPVQYLKIIPFIQDNSVEDYSFYDTEFPAEFGGHLASVLNIKMKEGSTETYSGIADFNFFSAGISAQGPIKEERSSFFVSARKSYLNNFYTGIFRKDNSGNEQYWLQPSFWDMNLKYTHHLSEKSLFSASFFHNYNRIKSGVNEDVKDTVDYGIHRDVNSSFGNTTGSLNFRHNFSEDFNFSSAIVFAGFKLKNTFTGDSIGINNTASSYINRYDAAYSSKNNNIALKLKAGYNLYNEHQMLFGADIINHHFKTVDAKLILNDFEHPFNIDTTWESNPVNAQEYGIFAQDKFSVNDELNINGGLRFSAFINSGTKYFSVEPRVFASYKLFGFLTLNIAYDYRKEYLHLLSGSSAGLS